MIIQARFRFTLMHSGVGNAVIPISSFVANLRNCQTSYLQVSIPDYDTYIEVCHARLNGGIMKMEKSINNGAYQEICQIDVEELGEDIGGKNKSIIITGHSIFYNQSPETVDLIDAHSIKISPLHKLQCSILNNVFPGDTVKYDDYEFVPTIVRIEANEIGALMELQETDIIPYMGRFYSVYTEDDYYWYGTSFYNYQIFLRLGNPNGTAHHAGLCFKNIQVPQGATISSAFITLIGEETDYTPVNVKIYGNDVDDASPPASAAAADALVLTSASITWDNMPDTTPNITIQTPDLTSIIQEIVNRPGWAPGNAAQILFKDNTSGADTLRAIRSIVWGTPVAGLCKPELQIIWEG